MNDISLLNFLENCPVMPLDQNADQKVISFGCIGFSIYECGSSLPQMQQFCLFTYRADSDSFIYYILNIFKNKCCRGNSLVLLWLKKYSSHREHMKALRLINTCMGCMTICVKKAKLSKNCVQRRIAFMAECIRNYANYATLEWRLAKSIAQATGISSKILRVVK